MKNDILIDNRNLIKNRILKFDKSEVFEFCVLDGFNEEFFKTVDVLSLSRELVNRDKEINKVMSFRRDREDLINFQSMISEYSLTLLLYKLFKNDNDVKIRTSAISEVFLDKTKEDLQFIINDKTFNIDIKSQFCFNNYFNVNVKAHERFLKHKCNGYLLALINSKSKDCFKEVESIKFIYVPIDYFEKNKKYVNLNKEKSNPFFSLNIENITKDLK